MANKITVKIDADKARSLITERKYTNKEGVEVTVKEIGFELVEMKPESQKVVYDHEKFQLKKTHFAVAIQTKEEREKKAESVFVGDGVTQVWKNDTDSHVEVEDPNLDSWSEYSNFITFLKKFNFFV